MKELELYVHIPFCVQKCAYCDFLSASAEPSKRQDYVDALIREIRGYRQAYAAYHVRTIFVGGGTPSVLTPEQIRAVFCALRESFCVDQEAEVTLEVNPGTGTREKIQAWKEAGINRLSIGLQSVRDTELRMLGRIHTYRQFLEIWDEVRSAGFRNVNVDLISGIPGQTIKSWGQTLETVTNLQPEHLSAYSLMLEKGTPFHEKYGEGKQIPEGEPTLPDEETDRLIYEETERILRAYGYTRYEISNYAKEGYQCRHNVGYWKRKDYLGIGLGASSLIGNRRFCHVSDLREYQKRVKNRRDLCEETTLLSVKDEMEEFMFLGLRMTEGIKKPDFYRAFGRTIEQIYGEVLARMERYGLLEIGDREVRLTDRGRDISNAVFAEFLLE